MAFTTAAMPRIALWFLLAKLLFSFCSGVQGDKSTGYQVASLADLIPSVNCSTSEGSRNNSLTMIYRYGPCSPLGNHTSPNFHDILLQDQLRIETFRRSSTLNISKSRVPDAEVSTPVNLAGGHYVVTVGLGTPAVEQAVLFDTGSHISWVKCKPCAQSCGSSMGTLFDPSASSSYRSVGCNSAECVQLQLEGMRLGCDATKRCLYRITYGDESSSIGQLSRETLTLTPTVAILGFVFGCGRILSAGTAGFEGVDGLLGLARDAFSLPYQTYDTFGGVFSFCLPAPGLSGHLTLGASTATSAVYYTPLLTKKSLFYYIELQGISVGGMRLPLPAVTFLSTGTIIDSGTTLTYLPATAYAYLAAAFRNGMSAYQQVPSPSTLLDTCYEFSGESSVTIPTVVLHFTDVDLTLGAVNILLQFDASLFCLAFASSQNPDDVSIIGHVQQSQMEVVYDLKNSRIGFARSTCSA